MVEAEDQSEQPSDEFDAQYDSVLRSALLNVTIPAGLQQRLKQRLGSAAAKLPDASSWIEPVIDGIQINRLESEPLVTLVSPEAGAPDEVGWLRRSVILALLAAGIGGFALLANQWTQPAEPMWLARQCDAILNRLERSNADAWRPIESADSLVPAPVKSQLPRLAFVAQQPLLPLAGPIEGMLYRLDTGDGRAIVLIKTKHLPPIRGMTERFEILPTPSGGWALAAMSIGDETFVLAAACTEQQMLTYIRRRALT